MKRTDTKKILNDLKLKFNNPNWASAPEAKEIKRVGYDTDTSH